MAKPKISEMRALAKKEYKRASKGSSELDHEKEPELDYDKNGFIVLQHISEMPTKTDTDLVTDLSALEKRLDLYREKNEAKLEKDKSDHEDSHEDNPFSKPAKAGKKSRKKLLKSIFNNADKIEAAENADGLLILTAHESFRKADLKMVSLHMRNHVLFDFFDLISDQTAKTAGLLRIVRLD